MRTHASADETPASAVRRDPAVSRQADARSTPGRSAAADVHTVSGLLALQCTVGNAAVINLLRQTISDPSDRFERQAEEGGRRALAGPVPAGRRQSGASRPSGTAAVDGGVPLQRAIGVEIEVDRPVVTHEDMPVAYREKETDPWSTGHTIVVSSAGYKIVSDLRFGTDGAPYTVAEIVTEPLPVLPGEEKYFPRDPDKVLAAVKVAYDKLYRSEAGSPREEKEFGRLFPKSGAKKADSERFSYVEDGFPARVKPDFRVAPEIPHAEDRGKDGRELGLYVHFTVGLPPAGLEQAFRELVPDPEGGNWQEFRSRKTPLDSEYHLRESVGFAEAVGKAYASRGPADTGDGRAQLSGFAALLYTQLAGIADELRTDKDGLSWAGSGKDIIKNRVAVLSRVSMRLIHDKLPDPVRAYLGSSHEEILEIFIKFYGETHPLEGETLRDVMKEEDLKRFDEYRLAASGEEAVSQAVAFGGMTELLDLQEVEGVTIVPMELRFFGKPWSGFERIQRDFDHLAKWSRRQWEAARLKGDGQGLPSAAAPTSDEASSSKPSGDKAPKKTRKKKAPQGKSSSGGLRRSGRSTKPTDRYAPPDPKKKGS